MPLPCKPLAPWSLTFDLRERETLWTEENQARLVRIVAGYQLDMQIEEVEARLHELGALLPGLAQRCAYIKPSTLAALLADSPALLVPRLVMLRALLPGADIGAAAAAEPELLLLRDLAELQADVARLAQLLGEHADIDALVTAQPRFLDAELVGEVLSELRRLMPAADPVATLLGDPSWLLRVERGRKRLGDDPDT
ncbi:ATP-dependent zinc metalloprotease FTSH mitochondrial [Micractinium conductrix]|uniref:ATP-dependent zinc metalloprotease FTSH mitochondrial n=1 Tax=Micractinium conductrix TaxID=554055 RepID=A0A2P6VCC8_9CHLO|nr:ATP-dependent zinc metalloprotease FTSH mitochondrial [Micractinium conductrix]|eukprot:PSC71746.1 ATP-dependent zinc metalloprotease FTSH mitochondrial [Micractinium conductrix]